MNNVESLDLKVGTSVEEYFARIEKIVQNRAEDISDVEDNCGSWRESESPR